MGEKLLMKPIDFKVFEAVTSKDAVKYLAEAKEEIMKVIREWSTAARDCAVTSAEDIINIEKAKAGKAFITSKISALEKARKKLKAPILEEGRALDAAFSELSNALIPLKVFLTNQATFVEREQEKISKARASELRKLGWRPSYDGEEGNLCTLSDEEYGDLLATAALIEGTECDAQPTYMLPEELRATIDAISYLKPRYVALISGTTSDKETVELKAFYSYLKNIL